MDAMLARGLFVLGGVASGLAIACVHAGFVCRDAEDCRDGDAIGWCEPEGACSFTDPDCPSQRRYADRSDSALAGRCVPRETGSTGDTGAATTSAGTTDASTTSTSLDGDGSSTTSPIPACATGWWDCTWTRRIPLELSTPATITASEVLVDVPIPILLGAGRIALDEVAPDGADLRFVADDGTVLVHEVERWDPAGTSTLWLRVPTYDLSLAQRVWLYHGNPGAPAIDAGSEVWSSEHAGVWHLAGDARDSTANAHDGELSGAVTPVAGYLGGAMAFAAVADRIDVPAGAAIDDVFLAGGTLSAWMRPHGYGGNERGRLADKGAGGGGWAVWASGNDDGAIRVLQRYEDSGQSIWTGTTIGRDAWSFVAITFDAGQDQRPRIYLDGVEQPVGGPDVPQMGAALSEAGTALVIGNSDTPDRWFDGVLDEVRLERTVRTPVWIALQHAAMRDELVAFGPVQRLEDLP